MSEVLVHTWKIQVFLSFCRRLQLHFTPWMNACDAIKQEAPIPLFGNCRLLLAESKPTIKDLKESTFTFTRSLSQHIPEVVHLYKPLAK